jgi:hypothetical protein
VAGHVRANPGQGVEKSTLNSRAFQVSLIKSFVAGIDP